MDERVRPELGRRSALARLASGALGLLIGPSRLVLCGASG